MTEVRVPSAWLVAGYLPPLCARHGVPATKPVNRKFYTRTPTWVWVLAFLSVLIGVIILLAIRKTVVACLPGCETCSLERSRNRLAILGIWLADLALFLIAAAVLSDALILLWFAATAVALVWSFRGTGLVQGVVSKDGQWVTLTDLDPTFAAKVAAGVEQQAGRFTA